MAFDSTTYALSKKYTKDSLQGAGALKGDPGQPGKDATINGINTATLEGGENVEVETDADSETIRISAPGVGGGGGDTTQITPIKITDIEKIMEG